MPSPGTGPRSVSDAIATSRELNRAAHYLLERLRIACVASRDLILQTQETVERSRALLDEQAVFRRSRGGAVTIAAPNPRAVRDRS